MSGCVVVQMCVGDTYNRVYVMRVAFPLNFNFQVGGRVTGGNV